MRIGLTGGIATGKSFVGQVLKELGACYIDADQISRMVLEKDSKVYHEVIDAFGEVILNGNRDIDRKTLGKIVFSDKNKRKLLENLTHPEIMRRIEGYVNKCPKDSIIVIDAALLIESGLYKNVDYVWVTACRQDVQRKRLMERDHISEEEADNRIMAQMTLTEKKKYADEIIDTEMSYEETKRLVSGLYKNIQEKCK